jgi:hypothetical protein
MINIHDVLTEDEWWDIKVRTPTLFKFWKSKRKSKKTGRYREGIRILPHPEGYKEAWERRSVYAMLPRIGYRRFFAVFDRS